MNLIDHEVNNQVSKQILFDSPGLYIFKDLSLKIQSGKTTAIVGVSGAGKTTLISMLTGLFPSNGGNAWVAGFDIKEQLETV